MRNKSINIHLTVVQPLYFYRFIYAHILFSLELDGCFYFWRNRNMRYLITESIRKMTRDEYVWIFGSRSSQQITTRANVISHAHARA